MISKVSPDAVLRTHFDALYGQQMMKKYEFLKVPKSDPISQKGLITFILVVIMMILLSLS